MRFTPIPGLIIGCATLAACTTQHVSYLLECRGSQNFEWPGTSAHSLTTVYYRIDESRRVIFGQTPNGRFYNVCRTNCTQVEFSPDAISWTDTSDDGEGRTTRINSHLARNSGELTIRTDSVQRTERGLETMLHGESFFHCRKAERVQAIAALAP